MTNQTSTSNATTPTETGTEVPNTARAQSRKRSVLVSAVAVPVLVLTGFAMLAIIPMAFLVRGTFRDPELRALRNWAALLAGVYALPLALWAILPDRAPSLTKDMHPAFVPAIVAAALLFLARYAVDRRRDRQLGTARS